MDATNGSFGEFLSLLIMSGVFGLLYGSFLNVVIYRMPRGESIIFPGSRCPVCSTPINYRDNIPVLSFIFLHGRCRACETPISWRYPLIETVTSVMLMLLFVIDGLSFHFFADVLFGGILLSAAVIDFDHMIVPNRLTYPGFILGLLLSFRWGWGGPVHGLMGVLTGLVVLICMYLLGRLLFHRESLGMGDFKLISVVGVFLGPLFCFITLMIAVVTGGLWGGYLLVSGKKKVGQEIPFGPFIALGGICSLLFKKQILLFLEYYLSKF